MTYMLDDHPVPTPICDDLQGDGWSGDAMLVPLETSQQLEAERSMLLNSLRGALECAKPVIWKKVGKKEVPYYTCAACKSEWLYRGENEKHNGHCAMIEHKAVLEYVEHSKFKKQT